MVESKVACSCEQHCSVDRSENEFPFFYLMLRPRSLIHEFICSNVKLPSLEAVAKKKKKKKRKIEEYYKTMKKCSEIETCNGRNRIK